MSESTAGAGSSSRSKDEDKKLKLLPKNAKSMSTSAKRMQKELGEITLDPPPNCRYLVHNIWHEKSNRGNVQPDIRMCSITMCWQRGAQGWQPVRVGVDHPRAARLPVRGRRLLPRHPLHPRVPLQAAQGHLPHPHLPLQRQLPRSHLPWYSQGQLESCSHNIKGNW